MIGVAVIGCGRWGINHVRVLSQLGGARVVSVCDPHPANLRSAGAASPGARLVESHEDVLSDPAVDAVVVATPTGTHHELVLAALAAGKHVLCEKPLARTAAEAEDLVDAAEGAGRLLMVGHVFLFNPGIEKVKELLDAGELGDPLYLSASRTNLGPIRHDVNAAHDLASHDIAIFDWLLAASADSASASGGRFLHPGIEDVVFASLRYPDNVVANVRASWLDPEKVRQLTVVGTKRMLTWDDLRLEGPVVVYDRGVDADDPTVVRDAGARVPDVHMREPLLAQAEAFLRSVEHGRIERSDGVFALGVMRTLDAIGASLLDSSAAVTVR